MRIAQIHPSELQAKLNAGEKIHLLDVRQPEEHNHCRLPNSQLIPLPELSHRHPEVSADEGVLVVVYCHHGVRSMTGAAILQHAGHTQVASLSGGIDAWSLLIDPTVPRY